MKNIYCILITFLFGMQVQAQSFPMPGAEMWYSCIINHYQQQSSPNDLLFQKGYIHAWHDGDTTINGTIWSEFIYQTQTKDTYLSGSTSLSAVQQIGSVYYSTSNDTVYRMFPQFFKKEFLWYNNPQPGDVWSYNVPNVLMNDTDIVFLTVTSVSLYDLNGFPSKNIEVVQSDSLGNFSGSIAYYTGYDSFSNGYGFYIFPNSFSINTLMGMIPYRFEFNFFWDLFPVDMPYSETTSQLICFESNLIPYYHNSDIFSDCMGYITLSDDKYEIMNNDLHIYPNPVQDKLSIVNKSESSFLKVQLVSLTGQIIQTNTPITPQSTTTILLSEFKPGIYILKCSDEKGNVQTHKIIKN